MRARSKTDRIFQAKGQSFTAAELLARRRRGAHAFDDGLFATVYLSPKDYHRVHMPWTGTLRETVHVPGRLFSVGPAAVRLVPRLFARNERLVCHFDTDFGPMAVVMVGALLVSGVETVWSGIEIPRYGDAGHRQGLPRREHHARALRRDGALQLRFDRDRAAAEGVAELAPGLTAESRGHGSANAWPR